MGGKKLWGLKRMAVEQPEQVLGCQCAALSVKWKMYSLREGAPSTSLRANNVLELSALLVTLFMVVDALQHSWSSDIIGEDS